MTRVLQVITDASRRGPQVFAVDLAPALDSRGLPTTTVALAPGQGDRTLAVEVLGLRRLAPSTLWRLRRRMRGADIVLAQGSTTLPAAHLAGIGLGVPVVYRSIGDLVWWASTRRRRVRSALLLRRSARVVPMWPAAGERLAAALRVDRRRVVPIANAVVDDVARPATTQERAAARARFGVPVDAAVALCLGALSWEKDVPAAIGAIAALDGWHLLVVGDGPDRPAVERAAAAVDGRVHVVGGLDDVAGALAASDLLLLPSRTEGLPAVLMEAGLAGLPAVASDVGGVSTIVVDGVTGRLVRDGDRAGLIAALQEVHGRRDELGQAARRHCLERFTIDVVVDAWAALLEEVASERRHEARAGRRAARMGR